MDSKYHTVRAASLSAGSLIALPDAIDIRLRVKTSLSRKLSNAGSSLKVAAIWVQLTSRCRDPKYAFPNSNSWLAVGSRNCLLSAFSLRC